jgi:predicted ATP-dependent protease
MLRLRPACFLSTLSKELFTRSIVMQRRTRKLSARQVCKRYEPSVFDSCVSDGIGNKAKHRGLTEAFITLGQERFISAITNCVVSANSFSHVAVAGLTGRHNLVILKEAVRTVVEKHQSPREVYDWFYLYNFEDPHVPRCERFKRGEGRLFRKGIKRFLELLKKRIPRALEGKEVQSKATLIENEARKEFSLAKATLEKECGEYNFAMAANESGTISVIPQEYMEYQKKCTEDGKTPLSVQEWIEGFSKEEHEKYMAKKNILEKKTQEFLRRSKELHEWHDQKVDEIMEEATRVVVEECVALTLVMELSLSHKACGYIEALIEHAVANRDMFEEIPSGSINVFDLPALSPGEKFIQWEVSECVDNSAGDIPPIVAEHISSIEGLMGGYRIFFDGMRVPTSDHTKIFSGALARANGGYLILDIENIRKMPNVFYCLMQALEAGEITYDRPWDAHGMLHPEAIPLDVRVIISGPSGIMKILSSVPEFNTVFREFAEIVPLVASTHVRAQQYGRVLEQMRVQESLPCLDTSAIGKMVEYAHRSARNQRELSTDLSRAHALIHEAAIVSKSEGDNVISRRHIVKALSDRRWHRDFSSDAYHVAIREKVLGVSVSGEAIGEINCLYVAKIGNMEVGLPGRIAALAHVGKPGFVNVHSQAGLSGKIANKADATVAGLIRKTFEEYAPMAVNTQYSFEQMYGQVDGDSASLAIILAILSEIAQVPLSQSISITGSVDLRGKIQPIGGVNEKIEGFFDTCMAVGRLTGDQGVVIPLQNKSHLMLREDVVEAVDTGKFSVWAIESIEEAISVFTGMRTGVADKSISEGNPYPRGTFYHKTVGRLVEFSNIARKQMQSRRKEDGKKDISS